MEIMFLSALVVFVLGLLMGSFLNVLILRHNTGKSLQGRSGCLSCSATLRWYELVPVASYLIQLGRCRSCGSALSPQYPLVELLTGLLFLGLHLKFFSGVVTLEYLLLLGFWALVSSLMVAILVYDLRHKIIPNAFVYSAALIAFAGLFIDFKGLALVVPSWWALCAGPLLAMPFALLWLFSSGRWMGLGDAKLVLVMGWALGVLQGLTTILVAFWVGAFVSVILLFMSRFILSRIRTASTAVQRKGNSQLLLSFPLLTMKSEIPFAPFLLTSFWFVFSTGCNLFSYLHLF